MEYKISKAAQEYLNQYLDNLEKEIIENSTSPKNDSIALEDIIKGIRYNKRYPLSFINAIIESKWFIIFIIILSLFLIFVGTKSIILPDELFNLDIISSVFFILIGLMYGTFTLLLLFTKKKKKTIEKSILIKYWGTLERYIKDKEGKSNMILPKVMDYIFEKTNDYGISKDDIKSLLQTRNNIVHIPQYKITDDEIANQIKLYEKIFSILN